MDPHPAHVPFGTSVDADFIHFETGDEWGGSQGNTHSELDRLQTGLTLSRSYDIVIAEGSAPLQTLLAHGLVNPSAALVFLAADETFYTIRNEPTRFLWYALKPFLTQIDLCISISELVTEWVDPFLSRVPCQVVHPTTTSDKFEALQSVDARPSDTTFSLLSVGDNRTMKNYHTLVDAVELLNDRSETVSLTILGDGHPEETYASKSFVSTPGHVPFSEFISQFEKANAYVQPSRGDGFGVAAVEGMLAARPTLVTDLVGAKQLIDDQWVVDPSVEGLCRGIESMISLCTTERKRIGRTNRRRAQSLTPQAQTKAFREAIGSIDRI